MEYISINKDNQTSLKRIITQRKNQKEVLVTVICVLCFVVLVAVIGLIILLRT